MDKVSSESTGAAGSSDLALLLPAIAAGDRAAFKSLYERTSAKLNGIAVRVLGDPAVAEEVLQDVYLTVWNKAAQFDSAKASPITWLAVITRNRAIDRKRRNPRQMAPIDDVEDMAADAPLADAIVEQKQEASRLAQCLEALDERARTLIRDAFLGGSTYPELAERESVPLGTMKSWIRRGLQRLKGCLES